MAVGADQEAALREVREKRLLIGEQDRWLIDLLAPYLGERVLEIGCGWGNVVGLIYSESREIVAVDIDSESVQQVQMRYQDCPNVTAFQGDICDERLPDIVGTDYDSVLSVNVLEHIQDDTQALSTMRRALRPGGHLLLVVPAHQVLYNRMDTSIGHYRRYSRPLFARRMRDLGWDVVKLQYVNALGALGWWAAGRILGKDTAPTDQLKVMNALVPTLRKLESIVEPPFGTSLLVVAR